MNGLLLDRFVREIAIQTGIAIRDADRPLLAKKLLTRMQELSIDCPERYFAMLEPAVGVAPNAAQAQEWQAVAMLITTGESYFFRDRGQCHLLERKLLPGLIAQRRRLQADTGAPQPTLRIWSAGCATGEEIYSIAIALSQLLPDWRDWDLQLIGTDINRNFLQAARQGRYSNWSFRQTPPELRSRYFQAVEGNTWQIGPDMRHLARFRQLNLLRDLFAADEFQDLDLIICRNVFIYFSSAAIARVLAKFHPCLRDGGLLLCGHAELHDCDTSQFAARMYPASLVYQRQDTRTPATAPAPLLSSEAKSTAIPISKATTRPHRLVHPISPNAPPTSPPTSSPPTWEHAAALFASGDADVALEIAEALPPTFDTLLAIARTYSDRGELDRAQKAAEAASRCQSQAIEPLQVLAHIAEARDDRAEAKALWRRILYLEPTTVVAYLELAALLQQEGNAASARKQQNAARELLKAMPPSAVIDCGYGRPARPAATLLLQLAA